MPRVPEVIAALDDPRVADYRDVRDATLVRQRGLLMVEGQLTLRRLVTDSPFAPVSIFATEKSYAALADLLPEVPPEVPLYTAAPAVFDGVAGFNVHRGCLAVAALPAPRPLASLLAKPGARSLWVAVEGLTNHDNIGGIFRNAMAFGADGVLLCPQSCDPLYRKAIRVSLGASLRVPFTRSECWLDDLARMQAADYCVVALETGPQAELLGEGLVLPERVVLLLGTEGVGLSEAVLAGVDRRLRIAMAPGVDSLNVATAAGIALHAVSRQQGLA